MATPHACPVCKGSGVSHLPVSAFHNQLAACRPCKGTGIVWEGASDDLQRANQQSRNVPAFELFR